jgi:hypothetical protein
MSGSSVASNTTGSVFSVEALEVSVWVEKSRVEHKLESG